MPASQPRTPSGRWTSIPPWVSLERDHSRLDFHFFWIFLFTSWLSCATVGNPRALAMGDAARMKARAGVILEDGRKVTQTTNLTREKLFEKFCSWLLERGLSIEQLLFTNAVDIDQLNKILCEYGRWLFSSGKPYYHYSETLNSVSSRKPAVRRVIQQAWDLAAMWGAHEPTTHHTAMPFQILIAIISIAFCWGWSREAAIFSLAWEPCSGLEKSSMQQELTSSHLQM